MILCLLLLHCGFSCPLMGNCNIMLSLLLATSNLMLTAIKLSHFPTDVQMIAFVEHCIHEVLHIILVVVLLCIGVGLHPTRVLACPRLVSPQCALVCIIC